MAAGSSLKKNTARKTIAPAVMDGPVARQWPLSGNPSAKSFTMANFVTMPGGESFFAPSPQFLTSL